MPWISYGFISKSGLTIPLSPAELENTLKLALLFRPDLANQVAIPNELIYLYALYLYPISIFLLFFIRSRVFELFLALLVIIPFITAVILIPQNIMIYIGYGFKLLLGGSLALIIESLFFRK